jgi:predicted flavoprotein YhiN
MTMYLDNMTALAIIMALVSTMTMTGVAVYKAHQWEQAYHDVRRKLKIEMANR